MYFYSVNVISIAKCWYQSAYHTPKHMHDYFHLIYIISGKGCLKINNIEYSLNDEQLYICQPCCKHEINSDKITPLNTIEVKFSICDDSLYSDFKDIHGSINIKLQEVRSILENTLVEAIGRNYLYRDIINTNIFSIILKILKKYSNTRLHELM